MASTWIIYTSWAITDFLTCSEEFRRQHLDKRVACAPTVIYFLITLLSLYTHFTYFTMILVVCFSSCLGVVLSSYSVPVQVFSLHFLSRSSIVSCRCLLSCNIQTFNTALIEFRRATAFLQARADHITAFIYCTLLSDRLHQWNIVCAAPWVRCLHCGLASHRHILTQQYQAMDSGTSAKFKTALLFCLFISRCRADVRTTSLEA